MFGFAKTKQLTRSDYIKVKRTIIISKKITVVYKGTKRKDKIKINFINAEHCEHVPPNDQGER
jgi:hypothetical protein